jgi:hypothetical protein
MQASAIVGKIKGQDDIDVDSFQPLLAGYSASDRIDFCIQP